MKTMEHNRTLERNKDEMKTLFPNWKNFGLEDITETLEQMGHTVIHYTKEPRDYRLDPRFKSELKKYIRAEQIDFVFTSNYFPIISDACNELDIPYLSWCYDSPLILTYSKTVYHPCNYIFLFDSQMVQDLQLLGVEHAYYMPMAVNSKRLGALKASPEQKKTVQADLSFVGSLYTEKHTLYDRMECLDAHTRGYLEGIMAAQQLLYGADILEAALTDNIIEKLLDCMPIKLHTDGMETYRYVYANYFLCRKITQTERTDLLHLISKTLPDITLENGKKPQPMKLYTPERTPFLPDIKNMGTVHYLHEMPLVFRHSKINLNITLRSIKNGIPLRAMDIMGAGGFLLTNYQNDFNYHFVDGEDYASFSSPSEMLDKIEYYLSHDAERQKIAENGWKKVCNEHTYQIRMKEMLEIAGLA
ncbi:MAG: glycosyltransferase [Lachnospiraceae bacterium]|nr:glycosyltransferase [Lachnospiraceae bacterium]